MSYWRTCCSKLARQRYHPLVHSYFYFAVRYCIFYSYTTAKHSFALMACSLCLLRANLDQPNHSFNLPCCCYPIASFASVTFSRLTWSRGAASDASGGCLKKIDWHFRQPQLIRSLSYACSFLLIGFGLYRKLLGWCLSRSCRFYESAVNY